MHPLRLWDIVVRPLYNGRPVVINRKFTCKDAVERWYAIRASFAGKKRFVVGTFEEIDPPQENRTAEMNFGCYDFRQSVHKIVRAIERQPTWNAVNEDQLKDVKKWMLNVIGPETETRTYEIFDKCFANVYDTSVYRSYYHERRFGDFKSYFDRMETSSFTIANIFSRYTDISRAFFHMVKRRLEAQYHTK